MKLVSWNVNGIRAVVKKGFFEYLDDAAPDILCLQETKAHEDQLDETLLTPPQYYTYWHAGEKRGYSSVATFTKKKPSRVLRGTELLSMDTEGRILMTEHPDFLLYNVYFPNGGRGEERLRFKLDFYDRILDHFEAQRAKGARLVICGDVNTAHHPIDLKNPKENEKNSGFMPIERAWLDRITALGYVDTFRHFHPDAVDMYSWWDMRTRARERNAGWRIDYFIVTPDLLPRLKSAGIQMDITGSDHAPVTLEIT
ncbi:MAG: exodeoxyribonuclease III [Ignavibacteria bacterium]|nr:exodeoxyribonuclease III [Ignavibacteria bacterium]